MVYNCHLESNHLDSENKSTYEQLLTNPKKENIKVDETKALVKKLRDASAKRAEQADIIAADMRQETTPYIIVCGDFNDTPMSYVYGRLSENLYDVFVESGNGYGYPFRPMRGMLRIDYILRGEGIETLNYSADESATFSDHLPVMARLKLIKE